MSSSQHTRPLWVGLLACALTPTILLVMELMASYERVMLPLEVVLIVSLPISLIATYVVALPYILWLKRRSLLTSLRICVAGLLVGGAALAAFNFYMNWYPQMRNQSFAMHIALVSAGKGALSGSLLGFIASVALVFGAGIPIRASRAVK